MNNTEANTQRRFEYLLAEYRALRTEIREAASHHWRISQFAILLSGGLIAAFASFSDEILGSDNESAYILLLLSPLYIGMIWASLGVLYVMAETAEYIHKYLRPRLQRLSEVAESPKPVFNDWEDFFLTKGWKSGPGELAMWALTLMGDFALAGLPVIALLGGYVVIESADGGFTWASLTWEAKTLLGINVLLLILTVPMVVRDVAAFMAIREPDDDGNDSSDSEEAGTNETE